VAAPRDLRDERGVGAGLHAAGALGAGLRDPAAGGSAPDRCRGEIFVRGPSLYSHYEPPRWYADPRRDGWYGTGDLGRWRDGGLEVLGRRDDRIVSGGENVDPIEVEAALEALPEVAGAVVFGLPDREWGERVAAAVVLRAPAPTDELRRSLADRLATYKHPRRWFVVSELPVTRAGKKDRRGAARRLG
jgi:acyl-CoA synthetase (AMP-forming)/AMP-acid ligase II